jgi:hypothetical protein
MFRSVQAGVNFMCCRADGFRSATHHFLTLLSLVKIPDKQVRLWHDLPYGRGEKRDWKGCASAAKKLWLSLNRVSDRLRSLCTYGPVARASASGGRHGVKVIHRR